MEKDESISYCGQSEEWDAKNGAEGGNEFPWPSGGYSITVADRTQRYLYNNHFAIWLSYYTMHQKLDPLLFHHIFTLTTSSSAIAERSRCRVGYLWPNVEDWNWETIFYGHYRSIFNHFDVIGQQSNRIRWWNRKVRIITPLKVIQFQDHRDLYQSKARMRLPISN